MLEQLSTVLNQYGTAFHDHIPPFRKNRYVQIVVLRETKSHAIFTTEGQTLDVERLQAGITTRKQIDRVVMYKRKQIAPERRTGKALLRNANVLDDTTLTAEENKKRNECQIMGASCGSCPDCILYGFAATKGNGSQRSRVLTDSGFIVRDIRQVMRNVKLNAIQDTTAGGIAGSAFATRENVLPQIFIPTVETLLDVTATEFAYVLGNILKTTRYGAESNREGFIRNHILGIYFSDVELFSNLELTQYYYDALIDPEEKALPEYLSLDQFASTWSEVEKRTLNRVVGQNKKVENIDALLDGIRTLYGDEKLLQPFLRSLVMDALAYEKIQNPPKNAGKNRKNKKASSEEEQFEEEDTSEEEDV